MFKSFIKTALRTIRRNPLTSFINIFGLAVALGCAIMVYAFVDLDLTTDQFHENKHEIYLATANLSRSGTEDVHGITPIPYAERLRNDYPQIDQVVRVESRNGVLKAGMKVFNERFTFVDPEYLDMFTFPLETGNPDALKEPNKIILSKNAAIRYFGEENAVGQVMTFDFGNTKYTFEVAGVAKPFPVKMSMGFSVLANFDQLDIIDPNFKLEDWSRFLDATFIRVKNRADIATINESEQQYVAVQNEVQRDWPATQFGFVPWTDLFMEGENMKSTITGETDSLGRLVLTIIGIFILVLAVFNYINISIVSATKRLKEIGVRKVMGGSRRSLVTQFLSENILMTLFALVLGLVLAITLLIPGFDRLFTVGMDFDLTQPELWVFLVVLVTVTGLVSGAYPALYISNFNAVNIFRGRLKFGGKNRLTKVFLTFQYILAVIAVVAGIVFTQNTSYQKDRDWGFDEQVLLSANVGESSEVKQLLNAMAQNPNVVSLAPSQHHINRWHGQNIVETTDGEKRDIMTFEVGPDYIETMGLELLEGSAFQKDSEADFRNVVVNEMMARSLNPESALGEKFRIDSLEYTVIGVVKDFHQWSFFDAIEPMILKKAKEEDYSHLTLQIAPGKNKQAYEDLEAQWASLFPEKPFNGFYQESTLEWYFIQIDGHGKLMQYVAALCIILSSLGLYGLVSLNVASRTKEFSIRKALGANLSNLVKVINRQFVLFLGIALVLGVPLSYLMMDVLLNAVYAYHKPLTFVPFAIALVLVVLMVLVTVSSQVRKVMTTSPTEGLRSE